MEYGISLIVIIAVTGGVVAYLGDKIGSKIGKKRIRLFGMRPHKTSIVVTIITGIMIATATIGVSAILSQNVRTALFGMGKLEARMSALNRSLQDKTKELEVGKMELSAKTKELQAVQQKIDAVHIRLENAELARQRTLGQLETAEQAYQTAEHNLVTSRNEIQNLEATKAKLADTVTSLESVKAQLIKTVTQLREGDVLFQVGEVLAGAIVKPGLTETEYEYTLAGILNDTNNLVLARIQSQDKKTLILVNTDNLKAVATELTKAQGPMLVRVIAAGNAVFGEPTMVTLVAQPYQEVYAANTKVYQETVLGGSEAEKTVLEFLKKVNATAKEKGVLPNPLTGEVGSLDGSELYATIEQVRKAEGRIVLEAYTKSKVFTEGPLIITIRVHRV